MQSTDQGAAPPFDGAKLGLIVGDCVLTLLRDDRPGLVYSGCWDLPGGGREGMETPDETALRELHEELGLHLPPNQICYREYYPGPPGRWFLGAFWPDLDPGTVRFGSEGQDWALMPLARFLSHPKAIEHLQDRLRRFLKLATEPKPIG